MIDKKSKEVTARLGDPKTLRSVTDTARHIGETVAPRLSRFISEAKRVAQNAIRPLNEQKTAMKDTHQAERAKLRSEEHTSELQSLMRISYAVFCLKKKKKRQKTYKA